MVSILDIGRISKNVKIQGTDVPTYGITAQALVGILLNFPQLRKVIAEKSLDGDGLTEIVMQAPEAAAQIMAAGLDHPDDPQYIAWASKRSIGEQFELLSAIVSQTFPQGIKSFMDAVQHALDSAGARGWGPATKSPGLSSSASATATPPATPGDTPHAS